MKLKVKSIVDVNFNMLEANDAKGVARPERRMIPAVVQDICSSEVLMLAYVNKAALKETLRTGRATFFSRERKRLWTKGETSGNFINVREIYIDCDNDTVLIKGEINGPACHTKNRTCFFKEVLRE